MTQTNGQTQQPGRALAVAREVSNALQLMATEFRAVLPAHIEPAAFIRVAQTAIQMNPDLQQCTTRSLIASCTKLAEVGLQPDGESAALVAYNVKVSKRGEPDRWEKQAKAMPMVFGIRDLVRRSGQVKDWKVRLVRKGDLFRHIDGDVESLVHEPCYDDDAAITHVYSIAYLENGELSRHVMTIAAVDKIRLRSRSKDNGPWVTDYPEMVKKTCLRQHSKALPKAKDDIARARIMGSLKAIDEAEDVLQLESPHAQPVPQLSMHESARRRLAEATETHAFDVEESPISEAEIVHAPQQTAQAAPKAARKPRKTPAERLAEAEGRAPAAPQGNGQKPAPAAAVETSVASSPNSGSGHSRSGSSAAPAEQPFDDGRDLDFERDLKHSQEAMGEARQAADDRFPGDPDPEERAGEDPEELAYRDGWHARSTSKPRVPPRSLSTQDEVKCWLDGWDAYNRTVDLGNAPQTRQASEAMLDHMVNRVFS